MKDNRRDFIKRSTTLAAAFSAAGLGAFSESIKGNTGITGKDKPSGKEVEWPIPEKPDTPKLCVGIESNADANEMRQVKQMGADHVVMGGPPIPWTREALGSIMDRFKAEGLTVINMMIGGFPNTIYGREGRDEEIKKVQDSLVAAGQAGLPVVEYNFYAHRLMEGYYEVPARGGAGNTGFDYERGKNLPHDPKIGEPQTAERLWSSLSYFLKAVIPVAEKAGVRMALHPNDPPIPLSHENAQIMATFSDWKRLLDIVESPSNGMTFDCGVSREMGEDPLEVLHYLGSRDRINHMHWRNVTVEQPYVKYQEVFFDEGQVNLFAVMRDLIKIKYSHGLYPEHPRALDYDRQHPGGIRNQYPGGGGYAGQVYNFAFARATKLAVLSMKMIAIFLISTLVLSVLSYKAAAQTATAKVDVPDWALPGSATHKQVPPPADFHRATRTDATAIGIFDGQSDVGAALVPGSSAYDAATGRYTIVSAGYNVWYERDEFRYLWKKVSGDVSLAADIDFPDTAGYGDRKAILVIRQSLDDDSKEAMVALHGAGLMHLAWRPEKDSMMKEMRVNHRRGAPSSLDTGHAKRIGIEKRGDGFAVFVSMHGEPMHQFGDPVPLHIDGPFYVGIGFCSHLPAGADTAILSDVVLVNAAGEVR